VCADPAALIHKMAGATDFAGERPETAVLAADDLDPVVSAGQVKWSALTKGGLFSFQGRPVVIESAYGTACTPTFTIIDEDGAVTRAFPASFPFSLSAHERIKATSVGAAAGATVAVVARLAAQKVL
jgi:hypothetical protein